MKSMRFFIALCFILIITVIRGQAQSGCLLPIPLQVSETSSGPFHFKNMGKIAITHEMLYNEAEELCSVLQKRTGCTYKIEAVNKATVKGQVILLGIDPAVKGEEGYVLEVTPVAITIKGNTPAGVFYGIQTLDQLLIGDGGNSLCDRLNAVTITDIPRLGYRSLMLDPARHFIPLADVKLYIDRMAKYKFNVLQLHLTDDQGWRVEIKKYPHLTEVGGRRDPKSGDNGPHNGFYTQEQLQELVAYAAKKHIEIVPELDIPGHTAAAIFSYPHLGCERPLPIELGKTTDRMLCAGSESVYEFYADVIKEISQIFPSKRIHLGGDEAVMEKNWSECKKCRAFMKKQEYIGVRQLMGYFFDRINQIMQENGKEPLLWCELDNIRMPAKEFLFDYPKNFTLFTWRMGLTPKCIELTREAGIKLIAAPGEYCYFDYPQLKGDLPEFNNWGMPTLDLKRAYEFDPGYGLPADKQKHIIGVAGLLWGEAIQDINRANYMTYPRALALAEAGWSTMENRNWESFKRRLYPNLSDLMRNGIFFRVPYEIERNQPDIR